MNIKATQTACVYILNAYLYIFSKNKLFYVSIGFKLKTRQIIILKMLISYSGIKLCAAYKLRPSKL